VAANYPVPVKEDLRNLLRDLLGRSVVVDKDSELVLDDGRPGIVATYITDAGQLAALIPMDVVFACAVGGALSMIPPVVVQESVANGVVSENLLDNASEVLNICTQLLNSAGTPHLRFKELLPVPGHLPDDVRALLEAPAFRRDFAVLVESYGDGRCSVLVT
jgi:hypothetical protein